MFERVSTVSVKTKSFDSFLTDPPKRRFHIYAKFIL